MSAERPSLFQFLRRFTYDWRSHAPYAPTQRCEPVAVGMEASRRGRPHGDLATPVAATVAGAAPSFRCRVGCHTWVAQDVVERHPSSHMTTFTNAICLRCGRQEWH